MAALVCKPICKGCDELGRCICPPDKPTPIFLLFSVGMTVPMMVIALTQAATADDSVCAEPLATWLIVQALVALGNVIAAVYMYHKFSQPYGDEEDKDPFSRACNFFLYDVGCLFWMILLLFTVIWAIMGNAWLAKGCNPPQPALENAVSLCNMLIWIFLLLGGVVIALSLVVECCRSQEEKQRREEQRRREMMANPVGTIFGSIFGGPNTSRPASQHQPPPQQRYVPQNHPMQPPPRAVPVARSTQDDDVVYGVPADHQPYRAQGGQAAVQQPPPPEPSQTELAARAIMTGAQSALSQGLQWAGKALEPTKPEAGPSNRGPPDSKV